MQNFSSSTSSRRPIVEENIDTSTNNQDTETQFTTTTSTMATTTAPSKEEMSEIQYMMNSMEEL